MWAIRSSCLFLPLSFSGCCESLASLVVQQEGVGRLQKWSKTHEAYCWSMWLCISVLLNLQRRVGGTDKWGVTSSPQLTQSESWYWAWLSEDSQYSGNRNIKCVTLVVVNKRSENNWLPARIPTPNTNFLKPSRPSMACLSVFSHFLPHPCKQLLMVLLRCPSIFLLG